LLAAVAGGLLLLGPAAGVAQEGAPALRTNEAELTELARKGSLDTSDMAAVFAFVFGRLPKRVQVLPTENYYYFQFSDGGLDYTGNLRLSAADRDTGILHFAYNERVTDWNRQPRSLYAPLSAAQGVVVEKVEPLVYRVTFAGKTVTFALNDLREHRPPADLVRADEVVLGPIFDESGMRFFLLFNKRLKVFHYVLDETVPVADKFSPSKFNDRIEIGRRTGFAFYRDEGRRILVGVYARDSELNTYFDGPFDQLPDNFVEGDALRDAVISAMPEFRGQIDRLGRFLNRPGRVLIHPYLVYRDEQDLAVFARCVADRRVAPNQRARCFVIPDDEQNRRRPQPLALLGR